MACFVHSLVVDPDVAQHGRNNLGGNRVIATGQMGQPLQRRLVQGENERHWFGILLDNESLSHNGLEITAIRRYHKDKFCLVPARLAAHENSREERP